MCYPRFWLALALASLTLGSVAQARSIADERIAQAKPGKCTVVASPCIAFGKVAVLKDDCSPAGKSSGAPQCQSHASYWCGAGFQPMYRTPTKMPYFLESDARPLDEKLTAFTVTTPQDCRPPRSESCFAGLDSEARVRLVKGWYCKMLNLVQGFFEDGQDLVRRLRDNGGLIARFNSFFGGSPSLSDLEDKFEAYAKKLRAELNDFYLDEASGRRIGSGYYENRLSVLKELRDIYDQLSGKTHRAGMDMVRTAERGEVIAKKVQKVLIKVAGYAVFAFTGGNRIAQCLTEAGIETAANTVTQKLQGNELTLSGFGKDALRTLIFRCADALTGGPGGDVLGALTGGFTDFLKDLADKIKERIKTKMAGFWKTIASKVGWVVDKLSFLMDDAIVKVFSHAAEEVVVEFGGEAFPACLVPLFKKDWQGLFRCLGNAARKALGIGVPRGLFDAAMDFLEKNVPTARDKLNELAKFAGLVDDPTVKTLLTGLTVAAKAGIVKARACRDEIQGFSSIRPVFTCLARAFGTIKVTTLVPTAVWEVLQRVLSGAAESIVEKLREHRAEITTGLETMGVSVPETVLSVLRAGGGEVVRTFGKSAKDCLPKAGGTGTLKDAMRSTVSCLGQAARAAFGATGHALVQGLLGELAKAAEKGSAALVETIDTAVSRARAALEDIVLVPAPVLEAVRRAKASGDAAKMKAFALEIGKKCVRAAGKAESLRDYVRASARCLADAATAQLRAAGAASLTKLLADLRQWVEGLPKEKGDAAAALLKKIRTVADTLGLEIPLFGAADVKAELLKDARVFTQHVGACVGSLSVAANNAAKSHERLSSMARELRGALQVFGRCLQSTVAKAAAKAVAPTK